jgi:hypothetical protein
MECRDHHRGTEAQRPQGKCNLFEQGLEDVGTIEMVKETTD